MRRAVQIVERARSDVDDIFNWLVRRSATGGIRWYLEFRHSVDKIAAAPEEFSIAPESDLLGRQVRQALFKTRQGRSYRIIFELTDLEILVLRIRGPGQSPLRKRDLPN